MIRATARILQMSPRVEFDATPYFEQATEADIEEAVALNGVRSFGNMKIVQFMAKRDPDGALAGLFDHAVGHDGETVVDLDVDSLHRWLEERAVREAEPRSPGSALQVAFDAAAERIGSAFDRAFHLRNHFHLAACGGCGAPAFAQPCAICSFYPMGTTRSEGRRAPTTREAFVRAVEGSMPGNRGNLATWYYGYFRRTVAYKGENAYAAKLDGLVKDAETWRDMPDPGAIFDHVAGHGPVARPRLSYERELIWSVLEGLTSALGVARRDAGLAGDARGMEAIEDAIHEAGRVSVASMGDEASQEEAASALSKAVDTFLAGGPGRPRWVPVGNLRALRIRVEVLEDRLHPSASPVP